MMYVVIREVEGPTREAAAFRLRQDAEDVYEEAARVCENGPDDGPGDDTTVVTNCWLGLVDTPDREIAKQSALSGHFTLINVCFPSP